MDIRKNNFIKKLYSKMDLLFDIATLISPKLNTYLRYFASFGKKWDEKNPITLNDWVLWLKFNDYWNDNRVKQCADKYMVRSFIEEIGCKEILNELIAVYENSNEIEWNALPEKYVIKLNIGCGYNWIVDDSKNLDIEKVEKTLNKWMKEKYYLSHSEMQYKNVKPYILIEKYLEPKYGLFPDDYKFYCFDGYCPYVMVCTDRGKGGHNAKFWYLNRNWELMLFTEDAIKDPNHILIRPQGIEKAFEYAEKISRGFPFVRVDLYIIDGTVYFGEMTFTPSGGFDSGRMYDTDKILGNYVKRTIEKNR